MNRTPGTPAAQPSLEQDLAADRIDQAVFATQLDMAYEGLPQSALMTVGVVVIFTLSLTPFFPLQMALGWAGVMTTIAAGRYLLGRAYIRPGLRAGQ